MFGLGAQELILIVFVFAPFIVFITSLIDILKNDFKGNDKIIWVLVVMFIPIIGSLLYLIIGRKKRL